MVPRHFSVHGQELKCTNYRSFSELQLETLSLHPLPELRLTAAMHAGSSPRTARPSLSFARLQDVRGYVTGEPASLTADHVSVFSGYDGHSLLACSSKLSEF